MKSFEADADVDSMLNQASENGIKVVYICNKALREWLLKKGYSPKKTPRKQEQQPA